MTKQNRLRRKDKNRWLVSGFSQAIVLVNGIIITLTAFFAFSYFINNMSVENYRNTSQIAGKEVVEGVFSLESSLRLLTSIILLFEANDKDELVSQIRLSVPNLSSFDQILWLYEDHPGNWQYKTIFRRSNYEFIPKTEYNFIPNQKSITKLINKGVFANEALHIFSDFKGMDYVEEKPNRHTNTGTMSRPFAMVKAVKANNSKKGVIIGVSRAAMIFDQNFISSNDSISRLTIRDVNSGQRIYHMNRNADVAENLQQKFGFVLAGREWEFIIGFTKDSTALLLGKVPYIILIFGTILTFVGTLFIRNNSNQSNKLSTMNASLEQKNYELLSEVSERERLNEALSMAEKDNRAIIDSVSDVIFEIDTDGNVLFLSSSWQKITGFEIERSKGSDLFSMLYPEDIDKHRSDFESFINGRKQAYHSFSRLRISDGTFSAVEIAISMVRRDKNNQLRVVGTITDVEERRRAERALAEAEKKYRTIVENAAGGLYQLTPEGLYLSANPAMADILGYENPSDMLRTIKNANGAVYPDAAEREKFMNTLIMEEHIFGYETQVLVKSGDKVWVRENIRLVKDEQNNILYLEGSMEDITKRKEADIALLEAKMQSDMANRAKTEFIANMSHELRTPLNAIIGFSDIMQKETMGSIGQDIYKEYAKDINQSGESLLKIINEILDISKIESGSHELNEGEFVAQDILNSCLDMYNTRLQEKGIVLTNEANNIPNIIGEELSIKQVMSNLYTNAIKYTPKDGRITLFSNYDTDGAFRLSITDTGIGMSAAEVNKALSPFGQVDNSLDRSSDGVGLGLPLAQAIMGIHQGRLEILSEKSIGTTVTLIFPSERIVKVDNNIGV